MSGGTKRKALDTTTEDPAPESQGSQPEDRVTTATALLPCSV